MKITMSKDKFKTLVVTRNGAIKTPERITKEHLKKIKYFTESFGIKAVKIGRSN